MSCRACGVSLDRGATWSVKPATSSSWPPIHAIDAFVDAYYLGDYDQLSSDFTKSNSGFAGALGLSTTSGGLAEPGCVSEADTLVPRIGSRRILEQAGAVSTVNAMHTR